MEDTTQETPQKRGFWKVLVWIVIVLIVLAAIFLVYKYFIQDKDSDKDNQITGGDNAGEDDSSQQLSEGGEDEKPPKPPE